MIERIASWAHMVAEAATRVAEQRRARTKPAPQPVRAQNAPVFVGYLEFTAAELSLETAIAESLGQGRDFALLSEQHAVHAEFTRRLRGLFESYQQSLYQQKG